VCFGLDIIYRGKGQTEDMLLDPAWAARIGAIVSMSDPQVPPLRVPAALEPNLFILRLAFNDIPTDEPAWIEGLGWAIPPQAEHVRRIIEAAPRLFATPGLVVVHCEMGVSRSSAITYVLGCLEAGPGSEARILEELPTKGLLPPQPNHRLVSLAQELLGEEYRLLEALEEWAAARCSGPPNAEEQ
jgi:predicted protein tyrosine phosphatase